MYSYELDDLNRITITGPNYKTIIARDPGTNIPFTESCAQVYAENFILELNKPSKFEMDYLHILTHDQFRKRFTFAEKVAIESSEDPGVKVIEKDINSLPVIDLFDQDLIDKISYYVTANLISQSRFVIIMKAKQITPNSIFGPEKFNKE